LFGNLAEEIFMNTLVTGHTGTIGRHFPEKYKKSNVDLLSVSSTMSDKSEYLDATVIHLAGIVGPKSVSDDLETSERVNIASTLEFAEKSLELGVSKFLFTSTSHVYKRCDRPLREDDSIEPQNYYAEQKIRAEDALRELFLNSSAELTIIRIFSVLDWDCKEFTLGGLFRKIADGDNKLVIKNGDDTRDFLTPKKIAILIQRLAEKTETSGVWNLSSGSAVSVREAASVMLGTMVGENLTRIIQPGLSGSPYIVGDNHKLRNLLTDEDFSWNPGVYNKAQP
jgi:UDP-glucose 4-epimerase